MAIEDLNTSRGRVFASQGYKVVGIDARKEPVDLAKTLKYPPDLTILATETKADDASQQIRQLDSKKPFEGLDGPFASFRLAQTRLDIDH